MSNSDRKIFSISDLHLSLNGDKPMSRFGQHWKDHHLKVQKNWLKKITENDIVLLAGDHSWALKMPEAEIDMEFICSLPGIKILSKGNHDYWWSSLTKMGQKWPSLHFIQNNAIEIDNYVFGGTRGWDLPSRENFCPTKDQKIFERELHRLELTCQSIAKLDPDNTKLRFVLFHYPPVLPYDLESPYREILERYQIKHCIYGHLHHGISFRPIHGPLGSVTYHLTSADFLQFDPLRIL